MNIAKKSKAGMLILAEGNIDVVALHQEGFDCAVAPLGTALTMEQARLMSRYTNKAVVAFDSDDAGRKAALRAIPLLEKTGMGVKIVDTGASKDPDEYLKKNSADAFRLLIERSENHVEYRLMTIENKHDLATDNGRLSYLAEATMLLSELESKPEREIYGARVAQTAGVSAESVDSETKKSIRVRKAKQKKDFERKAMRPAAVMQPESRELRYKNEYSAAAEEGVIRCLVREPALFRTVAEMDFSQDEFTAPFLAKTFEMLSRRLSDGRDTREALILSDLDSSEASRLTIILQKPEVMPHSDATIREYIEKIRAEKYKTGVPDEELLLEIRKYKSQRGL